MTQYAQFQSHNNVGNAKISVANLMLEEISFSAAPVVSGVSGARVSGQWSGATVAISRPGEPQTRISGKDQGEVRSRSGAEIAAWWREEGSKQLIFSCFYTVYSRIIQSTTKW